jgi:Raf kinase inhibitor-like YbhB/YbcL family protein
MSMKLTSPTITEGMPIPKRHAGDGANFSPELHWTKPAKEAKSYALIVEDPDAPSGTFIHWVVYNIPPDADHLPEGIPAEKNIDGFGVQGMNDARVNGYYGPNPPPGKPHRYFFRMFALDAVLDLPAGEIASHLEKAMHGHLIDRGALMGTYHH